MASKFYTQMSAAISLDQKIYSENGDKYRLLTIMVLKKELAVECSVLHGALKLLSSRIRVHCYVFRGYNKRRRIDLAEVCHNKIPSGHDTIVAFIFSLHCDYWNKT